MSEREATVRIPIQIGGSGGKLKAPAGMAGWDLQLFEEAVKLQGPRDKELQKIRDHFEGGDAAISQTYFPKPPRMNDALWAENRRLLTHVNLVRPIARCWTGSVYSGTTVRKVVENPHADIVRAWVASEAYRQAVVDWNENAIVYGTSVAVPRWDEEEGEIRTWLPDPVYTWLVCDALDVRKVVAVIERKPGRVQAVTLSGDWVVTPDYGEYVPRDYGWLPVAVGYGIDRRSRGERYGLSRVRDAVDWSIRETAFAFNVSLMQKQQTRSLLKRIGNIELLDQLQTNMPGAGNADGSVMDLPEGFEADFITPEPKIAESIEVMKAFMALCATANSVPQDVLDATLTQSTESAEAARIRAIPLLQQSAQLVPVWRENERSLVLAGTGIVEYFASAENPVKASDLKGRTHTEILLTVNIIPVSPNEITQDLIARLVNGLTTPEDVVRELHPLKSDEDLEAMAADVRARLDKVGEAAAEEEKFKRDIARALYQGQTTKEVMANLTDLRQLVDSVGLPREAEYVEPWLPVTVSSSVAAVTGEVVTDPEGDIVGGSIEDKPDPPAPVGAPFGGRGFGEQAPEDHVEPGQADDAAEDADEAPPQQ